MRSRRVAAILAQRNARPQQTASRWCALRSGAGLGDSLYLQSIARHFVEKGQNNIEVLTYFPDVFYPLVGKVKISRFRRDPANVVAHYTSRKKAAGTDQFVDCCLSAGIAEPVDLRLDWQVRDPGLVKQVRVSGKPVIAVQLPRNPMGRLDRFGASVLPDCSVIQRAINLLRPHCHIVQIGKDVPLYRFEGIDLDLANRTTVAGLIDVATAVDGFLGYCSFVVPLAESLRKPALLVWSRKGLEDPHPFVRAITPQKVFHRPEILKSVMDDCAQEELVAAIEDLLCRARS